MGIKNVAAVIAAGPRKAGRGASRVQAFWPQAKTLPQAEFTSDEDVKSSQGVPARLAVWGVATASGDPAGG